MKKRKFFIPFLVLLMLAGTIGACSEHEQTKEVIRKTTTTTERPVIEEQRTTTTTETK